MRDRGATSTYSSERPIGLERLRQEQVQALLGSHAQQRAESGSDVSGVVEIPDDPREASCTIDSHPLQMSDRLSMGYGSSCSETWGADLEEARTRYGSPLSPSLTDEISRALHFGDREALIGRSASSVAWSLRDWPRDDDDDDDDDAASGVSENDGYHRNIDTPSWTSESGFGSRSDVAPTRTSLHLPAEPVQELVQQLINHVCSSLKPNLERHVTTVLQEKLSELISSTINSKTPNIQQDIENQLRNASSSDRTTTHLQVLDQTERGQGDNAAAAATAVTQRGQAAAADGGDGRVNMKRMELMDGIRVCQGSLILTVVGGALIYPLWTLAAAIWLLVFTVLTSKILSDTFKALERLLPPSPPPPPPPPPPPSP